MAKFYSISKSEMDDFLSPLGFKPIQTLQNCKETVYGKIVKPNICVRIYSGIVDTSSRGVGEDAIRVEVVYRKKDGSIVRIGSSKRVHRVVGWKANLLDRLLNWAGQLYPSCFKCSSPCVERLNKKTGNKFYGCVNYPDCNGGAGDVK